MSVLGQLLGGTHPFEHRGKKYSVRMVSDEVKLAYARRLFQRATEAAGTMRAIMSAVDYAEHLQRLSDAYLMGDYDFEQAMAQRALKTVPGMLSLAALLWGCDEAEMLLVMKERPQEVASLIDVVLRESFQISEEEIARAKELALARQDKEKEGNAPCADADTPPP